MIRQAVAVAAMSAALVIPMAHAALADDHLPSTDDATRDRLVEALSSDVRSQDNRARDEYRNPLETLEFFGLNQNQTVVEIWPGGGWYTEIIAPTLKGTGTYYAAGFDPEAQADFLRAAAKRFDENFVAKPELYGDIQVTVLSAGKTELAPEGSADLVLSFRNLHNWMAFGFVDQAVEGVITALKPGGYFGIVEHRLPEGRAQDPEAKSGYVSESYTIAMMEKAGLELVAKSDVNANPQDTADHPKGVWTLPPSYRLGDQDREKYAAIGESDRYTLLFRKPAAQ